MDRPKVCFILKTRKDFKDSVEPRFGHYNPGASYKTLSGPMRLLPRTAAPEPRAGNTNVFRNPMARIFASEI